MNRRSFLKRIAIAAAGVACGASLLSDRITTTDLQFNGYRGITFGLDSNPLRVQCVTNGSVIWYSIY